MNEEIIKLLIEAKQQYEERTELSKQCLCDFLYNINDKKIPVIIDNYIMTVTGSGFFYYKKIKPITYITYMKEIPTQEQIKEHYAARLELINLCINHFNNLQ